MYMYVYVCICMYMYVYVSICIYMYLYECICMYMYVYAYGPKTEVAKRFFFESDVLDATLMMGWGGVGWGMLTFV